MHEGKRDSVTGRMTTGHEWNGIEELDTPVPKIVLFFLALGFAFSVICWLLYPAFPLITTYTKGLLGVDQQQLVTDQIKQAATERTGWEAEIASKGFAAIEADPILMQKVRQTGQTLFRDNCAACHGTKATGGPGFPNLTSKSWLWGGTPEAIAETIRIGINSGHPDTRVSQMLAFGRQHVLDAGKIEDVVAYVQSLSGTQRDSARIKAGQEVFAANCVACHGADAKGKAEMGAPDLTDRFWIYGGDSQALYTTIYAGRQGYMPHWEGRLSETNRKILALYVSALEAAKP
ncbi:cytochrome-c oxidase, cbb3-type subunit III [Labrys sp. KNU-23]|uniref:cytochrome-c oxidase, cbb3-type subunit III n=1 Tax=Labrys sp. KNU-23 TaxID=2789216 RepID=UPI0011EC77F5|nr:cytochrome-c oxidase, cbb3-type subunit III [Labrys sp. KNU-23]QEN85779.1 cytochrome-c oxidase, cbb3-type subunit III [Labrys sp. KNU-23]